MTGMMAATTAVRRAATRRGRRRAPIGCCAGAVEYLRLLRTSGRRTATRYPTLDDTSVFGVLRPQEGDLLSFWAAQGSGRGVSRDQRMRDFCSGRRIITVDAQCGSYMR